MFVFLSLVVLAGAADPCVLPGERDECQLGRLAYLAAEAGVDRHVGMQSRAERLPRRVLKFRGTVTAVVTLGSVAYLEKSLVCGEYKTLFAKSICRIDGGVTCARPD